MHASCSSHSSISLHQRQSADSGNTSTNTTNHCNTGKASQAGDQAGSSTVWTDSYFHNPFTKSSHQLQTLQLARTSVQTTTSTDCVVSSTTTTAVSVAAVNSGSSPQDCHQSSAGTTDTIGNFAKLLGLLKALVALLSGAKSDSRGDCGNQLADHGQACEQKPAYCEPKPVECEPSPPKCEPVVAIKDGAKIWGDPHFVGADGGKYDIHGEAGKTYNILSDKGIQMNAKFDNKESTDGATYIYETGFTLDGNQVYYDKDGNLKINGESVGDGSHLGGAVVKEGNKLTVNSAEYKIELEAKGNSMDLKLSGDNVNADGVMPHGLWGQPMVCLIPVSKTSISTPSRYLHE